MSFELFGAHEAVHVDSVAVWESAREDDLVALVGIRGVVFDVVIVADVLAKVIFAYEALFATVSRRGN